MTFNEYQEETAKTAIYPKDQAVPYLIFGLTSEAGEVAGKYKKVLRDQGGVLSAEATAKVIDELSDVMWYISQLSKELGMPLEHLAAYNINKLRSRQERGVLAGSGDNR